jgi:hypothetical protein
MKRPARCSELQRQTHRHNGGGATASCAVVSTSLRAGRGLPELSDHQSAEPDFESCIHYRQTLIHKQ